MLLLLSLDRTACQHRNLTHAVHGLLICPGKCSCTFCDEQIGTHTMGLPAVHMNVVLVTEDW